MSVFDKNPTPVLQNPSFFNCSGFYFGAVGGYKYSTVDHDLTLGGTFNQIAPIKSALESRGSGELNNDGAEVGGLLGSNFRFRQLVFGLEAAGGYQWARESSNAGAFVLGEGMPPLGDSFGHADLDARVANIPDFRSHHDTSLTAHDASIALIYRF